MKLPLSDCHTHVGMDRAFYLRGDFSYALDLIGLYTHEGRAYGVSGRSEVDAVIGRAHEALIASADAAATLRWGRLRSSYLPPALKDREA